MGLKITILGCGSSGGVPRIGHDWGACDPCNPRNRRLRCSILVQRTEDNGMGVAAWRDVDKDHSNSCSDVAGSRSLKTTSVLVDTSPDLRMQLLDNDVSSLDAVIYTHEHADHTHGIDDLRVVSLRSDRQIDTYMSQHVTQVMTDRFSYCFQSFEENPYPPIMRPHVARENQILEIQGAAGPVFVLPFRQRHGRIDSLGLRFGNIAYSPDLNDIPDSALYALENLDVWIVGALRYKPHMSHFSLDDALRWIDRIKPRRAVLTNMHIDLDYDVLRRDLPDGVEPAYDGLMIETMSVLPEYLYHHHSENDGGR